jgi:acyl carrier protein
VNESDLREKLAGVFRSVFDDPSLTVRDETRASDVDGWDSLAHVDLIVAVEKAFGVRFTTKDVQGLACVGDLVALIARRSR